MNALNNNRFRKSLGRVCLFFAFVLIIATEVFAQPDFSEPIILNDLIDNYKVEDPTKAATWSVGISSATPPEISEPAQDYLSSREYQSLALKSLADSMKPQDRQWFLAQQKSLYRQFAENLQQKLAQNRQKQAELPEEITLLRNASSSPENQNPGNVSSIKSLFATRNWFRRRQITVLALMLSRNLHPAGSSALLQQHSRLIHNGHNLFEAASLLLNAELLEKRLKMSQQNLQIIEDTMVNR